MRERSNAPLPDGGARGLPVRLNAPDFEAFLRGRHGAGTIDLHRKLDGARIARARWRRVGATLRIAVAPGRQARAALDESLRQLASALRRFAPRRVIRVAVGTRAHALLPARGPIRARRGSPWFGATATRAAIRATLREVPIDYGASRGLVRQREPQRLALAGIDVSQRECWLLPAVARRFVALQRAAAADGIALQLVSGFRSAAYQARILERKRARGAPMAQILEVNAAPGYSEHHGGRAVDLATPGHPVIEAGFEQSPAFAWLSSHAARWRLRLSYPRGNRHGIVYEPWHWYFED
jgi:D-alanyl-D-alanine carboxypeptidase